MKVSHGSLFNMSSLSYVPTALSRSDSKIDVRDKVTALLIVTTPNAGFEVVDLEAYGTDS